MKKILSVIAAMLALASCIREDLTPLVTSDGDNVVLNFGIVVPEAQTATKSISEPAITSLTVVAFDEYGYFVAAADATPDNGWDVSSTTETKFTVKLPQSASARKLHFIANGPEASTFSYGAETDIMTGLVSEGGNDAYWQTLQVSSLLVQDQSSLTDRMQRIPMIRNYAKIRIGDVVESFEITGYALINIPTSGTMVPYNMHSGSFQEYEERGIGLEYSVLKEDDYSGFMPENVDFAVNVDDQLENIKWITSMAAVDGVYPGAYTYESYADCETALLVRGKYSGSDTETYYKVAIYDETCGNHDILRNIEYVVNITNVAGAGYTTALGAAGADAGNNISASIKTKNILNISDGTQSLYVEYTAKRVVSTDEFTLKYKFLPTSTSSPVNKQHSAGGTPTADEPITITRKTTSEDGTAVIVTMTGDGSSTDKDGFSTLTIKPQSTLPSGSDVWSEEITIKSTYNNVVLSRTVTLYMLNPYTMSVSCNPRVVNAESGQDVQVNINLPVSLPDEIFPLVFDIESDKMSVYPDTRATAVNSLGDPISMPVVSGTSIIPKKKKGDNTFHFQRTLTKEEYDDLCNKAGEDATSVAVPCFFRTNTEDNASMIYVHNQYFEDAYTSFLNGNSKLTDNGFYGAGNPVGFIFVATEAGEYTIESDGLGVATKAAVNTVTLSEGDLHEETLYTTTWSSPVSVTVKFADAEYLSLAGETRNKLAMKATSIKVGGSELASYQTFGVYPSEDAAKRMTGSIGSATTTELKSSDGAVIVRDNLKETDELWFSYSDGNSIQVAKAVAKNLHEGAELSFTAYELRLEMSATLEGEQYYGKGKTVTLNLTTNKAGKYTVTFNETGASATAKYIDVAAGTKTGTVTYTTQTFGGAISATVTYDDSNIEVPGDSRNMLYIKPTSVTGNTTGSNLQNVKMSTTKITNNNWNSVNSIATFSLDQLKDGVEVEIDNLNSTTIYYFAYRYGNKNNYTFRYESMTAENLANGTAMSFGSSY